MIERQERRTSRPRITEALLKIQKRRMTRALTNEIAKANVTRPKQAAQSVVALNASSAALRREASRFDPYMPQSTNTTCQASSVIPNKIKFARRIRTESNWAREEKGCP